MFVAEYLVIRKLGICVYIMQLCILILPISSFLNVGKCLTSMTSNEGQYTNDSVLQTELFLVTVLLGGCNVEERF